MNDVTSASEPESNYVTAGDRFGRWVALTSAARLDRAFCRCDCGTEQFVSAKRLRNRRARGCFRCERAESVRRRQEARPYLTSGYRSGMLTTLGEAANALAMVPCRCDCGREKTIQAGNLRRRVRPTTSCGCSRRGPGSAVATSKVTHGMSKHPLYCTWNNMILRTCEPSAQNWEDYGGRGIQTYEPWRTDAAAFISWITENLGPRPDGCTLDRIDNDGHYEPGNLQWGTRAQQTANRRSVRRLTRQRDALVVERDALMVTVESLAAEVDRLTNLLATRQRSAPARERAEMDPLF